MELESIELKSTNFRGKQQNETESKMDVKPTAKHVANVILHDETNRWLACFICIYHNHKLDVV